MFWVETNDLVALLIARHIRLEGTLIRSPLVDHLLSNWWSRRRGLWQTRDVRLVGPVLLGDGLKNTVELASPLNYLGFERISVKERSLVKLIPELLLVGEVRKANRVMMDHSLVRVLIVVMVMMVVVMMMMSMAVLVAERISGWIKVVKVIIFIVCVTVPIVNFSLLVLHLKA